MGVIFLLLIECQGLVLFSFVCTKCLAPEIQSLGARGQEHPNRGVRTWPLSWG